MELNKILRSLLSLKSGGFKKNMAQTFSAKVLVTVIGFAFTPVFSRLYSPADYGLFGAFTTITVNFSMLSTLGYVDALGVSSSNKDFFGLLKVSVLTLVVSSLLLIPVLPYILDAVFAEESSRHADVSWLIIFGAFMLSLSNVMVKLNVHFNDFGYASKVGLSSNIAMRLVGLFGGVFPLKLPFGLLVSDIVHKWILTVTSFFRHFEKLTIGWTSVSFCDLKPVVQRYVAYPVFFLPSKYIGLLVAQFPVFYISKVYGLAELGQYTMASSLVVLPIKLLGHSVSSVYLRRFRDSAEIEIAALTKKMFLMMIAVLIIPVLVLTYAGPGLVTFILGKSWGSTGALVQVMSVYLIHQTFFMTISGLFQIRKLEKEYLMFQSVSFLITLVFCVSAYFFNSDLEIFVAGYSLVKLILLGGVIQFLFHKIGLHVGGGAFGFNNIFYSSFDNNFIRC